MKIKLSELLLQTIILCSLVMLAFTGFIGINITKYCLFMIVGLCFVKIIYLRLKPGQLVALLLILASCIVTIMLYNENPANHLIFFSSVTLAITLFHSGLSERSWKFLKVCVVIAVLSLCLQCLQNDAFDERGRLLIGFGNPNMTGIALCAPAMFLVLMVVEAKKTWTKVFYIAMLAIMIYMVFLTNNRGSFLTLMIFAVMAFLATKKKDWRLRKSYVYVILKLLPILVMLLYVFLFTVLPQDLEVMGKPLFSGREYSWKLALERLVSDPFSHHTYEDGTLNLFLEGARRYGLMAMVGYFWVLFTLKKADLSTTSTRNYLGYLGFYLCLFQQSFESTLITGSFSVYIWTYLLLGVASMKDPEEARQQVGGGYIPTTRSGL